MQPMTLSAVFNTLFVLLIFHLLAPGSNAVVGERLADTVIGCILALTCSYILPAWERNTLDDLARALRAANLDFLQRGLDYVRACRAARAGGPADAPDAGEAEVRWRLSRKNVHIAFSNFASAFYRMMDEPVSRQRHVPELNRLLIQHHTLASQIAAVIPHLTQIDEAPEGICQALTATQDALEGRPATQPNVIETEGDYATIAYPLRQMTKAALRIDEEMRALEAPISRGGETPAGLP